jgi:hypothetical protein
MCKVKFAAKTILVKVLDLWETLQMLGLSYFLTLTTEKLKHKQFYKFYFKIDTVREKAIFGFSQNLQKWYFQFFNLLLKEQIW